MYITVEKIGQSKMIVKDIRANKDTTKVTINTNSLEIMNVKIFNNINLPKRNSPK